MEQLGKIRLAMLDEKGNILQVSREFSLRNTNMFAYSLRSFFYNGEADTLDIETAFSGLAVMTYLFVSILGTVFTCLSEWFIAGFFGLERDYGKLILATNAVSQIAMRLLALLLYGWLFKRYLTVTLFLEVVVFAGEFLFYSHKMWVMPRKKILLYTITANTVSLIYGWVLNLLIT